MAAQIGRATAENHRQVDPAGNRQPRARAILGRDHDQFLPIWNNGGTTGAHLHAAGADVKRAARPGDEALIVKAELETAKRDLDPRRRDFVADEEVRHRQRIRIERATGRNADGAESAAAEVLHAAEKAGTQESCSGH